MKVFLAVAANVGFDVIKFITGHEYKQRSALKKEVIVEPPPEYKHDGMIWVLKKVVNCPYDEVQQSHLRIDEALKQLGCKKVAGAEDMHTYHNEQGELNGLVYSYTEEFYSAGTEEFHDTITNTLQKRFAVGRKDERLSKSTGLDIFYTEEGIIMKQNDHRNELEEIKIENNKEPDRELNLDELAKFRGKVARIQRLSEGTRPDLAYDTLLMSMKAKNATVADMKKLVKIIRKAKEGDSIVTFKRIGRLEDLKIIVMSDASFRSMDGKVRSVEGRVIFLSDGINASP